MSESTHILISNDDGIHAPGILALIEVAREFGEISVVAPDSPQSGMGHAISIGNPLRMVKEDLPAGQVGYAVSGTPADCVKLATGVLMKDQKPDLILSGINHGYNSSVSSIYSGTLSAAREGVIQGFPAVGFSFGNYQHDADMRVAKLVARRVLTSVLANNIPPGALLNVNIPDVPVDEFKGIKVVRQAMGRWVEEFDERVDPYGVKYYWLRGNFELQDEGEDTDVQALRGGYASLTPMTHDLTAHAHLPGIASWSFDEVS